jgi:hypothetical protein
MSIDHWETLHQFGGPSHVLVLRRSLDKGHLQLCSLYDVEYTYQERDTCQQHVVPSHRAARSIESNGAVAIGTIDNRPKDPIAPHSTEASSHINSHNSTQMAFDFVDYLLYGNNEFITNGRT